MLELCHIPIHFLFLLVSSYFSIGAPQDPRLPSVVVSQKTVSEVESGFADRSNDDVDFGTTIRPILETHCFACHGATKQESNYRLDVRSRALSGADFGSPPIVPGEPENSPLFQYISDPSADLVMPPHGKGKPLSKQQAESVRKWIQQGANWPDEFAGKEHQPLTTDHWSFQPITEPAVPSLPESTRSQANNPIDHFVISKLLKKGLTPAETTDRISWIRRVYLVMHGLLPTQNQVDAYLQDTSDQANQKVIDEVLASEQYGQRWARHWLDVARFAESTGYEINSERKNAFYYRDYVIDSLNQDLSYQTFVMQQLAGDSLGVDVATGFLVGGAYDAVKSPDINLTLMQREDMLADFVNTTSTAFLGLTVGCARCHNHKFDPILQKDYYAMQAVFAGVEHGERKMELLPPGADRQYLRDLETKHDQLNKAIAKWRKSAPAPETSSNLLPKVSAKKNVDAFDPVDAKWVRFTILKTNSAQPCLDELEIFASQTDQNVALASLGSKPSSSGDLTGYDIHQLKHVNDGVYGNERSWIASERENVWVQIELAQETSIDRVIWGRERNGKFSDRLAIEYKIESSLDGKSWNLLSDSSRRQKLSPKKEPEDAFIGRLTKAEAQQARALFDARQKTDEAIRRARPSAYIGKFKTPQTIHRLYRGDPMAPREEVAPDALTVITSLGLRSNTSDQERRLKFAQWIASPENPLTARVIVNRVWHYHFGRGIVATPSDFGKNGIPPTHPELLDWLASEFIRNDWSLKWLHQTILSSATFAQSSAPRSDAIAIDADNLDLWRFTPRRLEAEAIRDCVLQISGKLNPAAGGPGFKLFKTDASETVHHYFPLEEFKDEHFRRMIYMTKIRQEQDEVFGVFDCPDGGQVIPTRSRSTTPLQALNLLNSRFMLGQAEFLAKRLVNTAGPDVESQIDLAFELMFLRSPSPRERTASRTLIETHGLEAFCRAMFNANEFLFVS